MQLLREIVEGGHNPQQIDQLKKSLIHRKVLSERGVHYRIDKPTNSFHEQFTVVTIKKPRTSLNTVQLTPLKNKTRFIPNSQLVLAIKQQKNKSLQYQKVYTQEYRDKSEYTKERRRFNKNVETIKKNRYKLSFSEQPSQLNQLLETRLSRVRYNQ